MDVTDSFLQLFQDGDVAGAQALLRRAPQAFAHSGYAAHPQIREFVKRNRGHCYKRNHLLIAELLIPDKVRLFRDAVLEDRVDDVQEQLGADRQLARAEFTGGRGIAQAIHHWISIPVAKLLLDAGADINALTTVHSGETPLVLQVRRGSVDAVRFLLEQGADPNLRPQTHMPSESMPDLLKLLMEHGWDIQRGNQLLHDANHGHAKRILVWLEHGVDPNVCDEHGATALHILAAKGIGREAIQALVDNGADINRRDDNGDTPLDLALKAEKHIVAKELVVLGAKKSR